MTRDRGDNSGNNQPISRAEIDRLLDRELSAEQRRDFVGRLRRDPEALDEVVEIRRLAGRLHRPISTPDLTARVLHDVDRRRGFLSARLRRRVRHGRTALAASLLLGLLSIAVAHRLNPDAFRLRDEATPVADLGEAFRQDSIDSGKRLADAVNQLSSREFASDAGSSGLVSDESLAQSSVTGRLIEFHVSADASSGVPVEIPERYLVLTASADAEVLALGGTGTVFTSIELSSMVSRDGEFMVSKVDWPAASGFTSSAAVTMRFSRRAGLPPGLSPDLQIEPGMVPMSTALGIQSAYIGRFDPFRDGRFTLDRLKTQPALPLPVSHDADSR